MLDGKGVAVVIPAYNEEALLAPTVEGVPSFVDRIYIVDDHSSDATLERARALTDVRVQVIEHERNEGVGAAIVTGYLQALAERIDVTAVMAADKLRAQRVAAAAADANRKGERRDAGRQRAQQGGDGVGAVQRLEQRDEVGAPAGGGAREVEPCEQPLRQARGCFERQLLVK